MKKRLFASNRIATAAATALFAAAQLAYAGPGIAPAYSINAVPPPAAPDTFAQTYYANSPSGVRPDLIGGPAAPGINTGAPLRKFVDVLPSVQGLAPTTNAGTGITGGVQQYLPLARPGLWPSDGADYYHLAIVEYTEQMHSDLPKPTSLRGYVQIEEPGLASTPAGSRHVPLFYPDGITPMYLPDASGTLQPVYAYDIPHYLGPIILATKGRPIRVKYSNLLPPGGFGTAVTLHGDTITGRNGDLFIPVDATLPGGGFQENRAEIHLHGGLTPWISDGTPHQWTVPVGETRHGFVSDIAVTAVGSNYSATPTLTIGPPQSLASATATMANGSLSALNLVNPGANYTAATSTSPSNAIVTIDPPAAPVAGTPATTTATATSTINTTFNVASLVIGTAGAGYLGAPAVSIVPPPASVTATATSTIASGSVNALTVGTGGYAYVTAPVVTISPPAAAAAAATTPSVSATNGALAIAVASGGFGYWTPPTVTVAAPPAPVQAAGTASINATSGAVSGIAAAAGSFGYWTAPTVSLAAPPVPVQASAKATFNATTGTVTGVTAGPGNFGYWTAPAVTISAPANPVQAVGAATLGAGAQAHGVASVAVNANFGYWAVNNPTVTLSAPPTQVQAVGTPTVSATNGALTALAVSTNFGYWTVPTVTIAAPPAALQATGNVAVNADGSLGAVTVNAGNFGYWNAPFVRVAAPPRSVRATAAATISAAGAVTGIIVTNPATNFGYWTNPTVAFTGGRALPGQQRVAPSVTGFTFTNGHLTAIAFTGGSGYRTPPAVTISNGATGTRATVTATVADGVVTGVTLTGGSGYNPAAAAPALTFSAPTAGIAATVRNVAINTAGVVTGITLRNPGSGYNPLLPPVITIGAPTVSVQALAAPLIVNGVITVALSSPGANYLTPPSVTISAPSASVTATAIPILASGAITGFTVTGGTNYNAIPTVTVGAPVAGTQATAIANVLNGAVTGFTVAAGAGYNPATPPAVTIGAPLAGVAAVATATVLNGAIATISMNAGTGTGYNPQAAPSITISPPTASTPATATALLNAATGAVSGFTITNAGTNYPSAPAVTIAPPPAAIQATATAAINAVTGAVTGFTITNAGTGYTSAPAVVISAAPASIQATALANVGSGGVVGGFTITNPGSGYTSTPNVTISPPPGAVQATATLTVTAGALTGVTITNAGGGYTSTPAVTVTDATGTAGVVNALIAPAVGASFRQVPDMAGDLPVASVPPGYTSPIFGEGTLYWTNDQSERLMFYHDHTSGTTRLNVYAGEAAGYVLYDPAVDPVLPGMPAGSSALQGYVPEEQIPLVIQDRTFVPQDVMQQDANWDTVHWGQPGDLWFPHVYETNQNPAFLRSLSNFGRWDWGPWFAIVYPAQFALPSGKYGDVTTTPEAYQDTMMVNGIAYPTVSVEPRAYRLRILNASNDRFMNLGFYLADPTQISASGILNTEVKQVSNTGAQPSATPGNVFSVAPNTTLTPWPNDGRIAPAPSEMGPPMVQIGNEGGLLPQWVQADPIPVSYDYNRRSVTVLNVSQNNDPTQACFPECHGLYLGAAERADVVVDFSQFAGRTLILYNDAPAPNPAYDTRIDYYTGNDPTNTINYATGGAPNTQAGYGPNTRTILQVKVAAAITTPIDYTKAAKAGANGLTAYDPTKLGAGRVLGSLTQTTPGVIQTAYAATQAPPIVGESAYNIAFNNGYTDQYGNMYLASANQPVFYVTDPGPLTLTGIVVTGQTTSTGAASGVGLGGGSTGTNPNAGSGTGYTVAPAVQITPPNCVPSTSCVPATATASVAGGQVVSVALTNPGLGYTEVPSVTFISGGGLTALSVTNGGSGYSAASPPAVTISGGGGSGAAATATVSATGAVTGLTITTAGSGYSTTPTVTIAPPAGLGTTPAAAGAVTMNAAGTGVSAIAVAAGGSGYVTAPAVGISAPPAVAPAGATAVLASGAVASFNVTGGTGYVAAPNVTIAAPPNGAASAVPAMTIPPYNTGTYAGLVLNTFTVSPGAGYSTPPAVTINDAGGTGGGATASSTVNAAGQVTGISLLTPGAGYTGPITVTIAAPAGPFAAATATASITGGVVGVALVNSGSGYLTAPAVTIDPPPSPVQAVASAVLTGGVVISITVTNPGAGYTAGAPTVSLGGGAAGGQATASAAVTGGGYGATAIAVASTTKVFAVPSTAPQAANAVPVTLPTLPAGGIVGRLMNPAIQELFEPFYGRMNATLGIEMPLQSLTVQTTLPLNYVDPATEITEPNTMQMWKITHNGVDAHPVHFHLVNVQVVNRVGWDGTVKAPEDNEIGWKETVKMNPLEDIIVVMRSAMPLVPFGLDKSVRPQDPSQPLGVNMGFTQFSTAYINGNTPPTGDAVTSVGPVPAGTLGVGEPSAIVNSMENYDNEYVWHCHILGHEENDFMRAYVVSTAPTVPAAAPITAVAQAAPGAPVVVSFTDPTPIVAAATYGNPANELGFKLQRAPYLNGAVAGPFITVATAPANATAVADPQLNPTVAGHSYVYQVIGYNAAGDGPAAQSAAYTAQ